MIEKGDNIVIHTEDEGDIIAVCTGVTHGGIVHYKIIDKNGYMTVGFVGSDYVEKIEVSRIEGAKELLKDLQESFLGGLALKIEANDFNLVSWLIEQHEEQKKEIDHLKETVRILKVCDEMVKEYSKKVKHVFPLENTAGYGQLCDKVVEQQKEIINLKNQLSKCTLELLTGRFRGI